jgi:hypothetical protein
VSQPKSPSDDTGRLQSIPIDSDSLAVNNRSLSGPSRSHTALGGSVNRLLPEIGRGNNQPVVVIPAWVWRGGPVFRTAGVGLAVGVFFGALGFAESGSATALVALVALGPVIFGIPMTRRMARFWPGAKALSGQDRVAVVRATRRGDTIGETSLAHAVIEYGSGLRDAHDHARRYRWVIPFVAALSLTLALTDSFFGSIRLALVSWLWVAIIVVELLWWSGKRADLLSNAARAETLARQVLAGSQ